MIQSPHKDKLIAAINNPKAFEDRDLLKEACCAYQQWLYRMSILTSTGDQYLADLVSLLNDYKDNLEVELIARKGSAFLKRQKGQLKLDNSVIEEFLPYLVSPKLLQNLPQSYTLETGSHTSFMSLAFCPSSIQALDKPQITIKDKDQDFTIGKTFYYKFSTDASFAQDKTIDGRLFLAVLAAECKVNYDKTMFQECAGTAARLKQGCPISKYYALVEYLDMTPEDTRLTSIDNVFLLRRAKRLPYEKRQIFREIEAQHRDCPISVDVMRNFVHELQEFINATWYNPEVALERGSFI